MLLQRFHSPRTTTGRLKRDTAILSCLVLVSAIGIEIAIPQVGIRDLAPVVINFLIAHPTVGGMPVLLFLILYTAARIDDYLRYR